MTLIRFARTIVCCTLLACIVMPAVARADDGKAHVLFDGKNTAGWKQCGPGSFELIDGTLVSKGGMGLFWYERQQFGDFIYTLDWKTSNPGDNSGVYFRFPDPGNDPQNAVKQGYEVQIHDTARTNKTGSVYNVKEATKLASKPAGEWNTYEIKAIGQQVTVKLNDEVVNEFTGKLGTRGHVGIQNHDANAAVAFRNIRVVELPQGGADAQVAGAPAGDLAPGLVGEYFRDVTDLNTLNDHKPFLVRVDRNVNFRGAEGQFHKTKLSTKFSARWTGILRIAEDGAYPFTLTSDDGSRLYIDDKLVLDKLNSPVHEPKTETMQLTKGDHPIRLEFQQEGGGAGIQLRWQPKGQDKPIAVPANILFHAKSAEAVAWDKEAWNEVNTTSANAWERMDYGPFLAHTIGAGEGNTALKGIAIKLGDADEAAILFDTELLRYAGGWTGGFVTLTGVTFDGSHGPFPMADGELVFTTKQQPSAREGDTQDFADPRPTPFGPLPREWGRYKGLYRHGNKIALAYTVGATEVLETPSIHTVDGQPVFTRTIKLSASDKPLTMIVNKVDDDQPVQVNAEGSKITTIGKSQAVIFPPRKESTTYRVSLSRLGAVRENALKRIAAAKEDVDELTQAGPGIWPKTVEVKGSVGTGNGPYVVDTIPVPEENPYDAWIRFAGLDFFSDGRAALSTWSGDVWVASGVDDKLEKVTWKRFASGLFQPLGLKIVDDQVYVLGRDGITRFTDGNNDGEADFYENFNNDVEVSESFHEFAFDLQTDTEGNFYFAKAGPVRPGGRGWQTLTNHNGTVLKVSKDGSKLEVYATGVRAPNGMGAGPNGEISVADNEGTWTPQCRLSIVKPGGFLGVVDLAKTDTPPTEYDPPICWLPHGEVDNSSGGQVWVPNDKWGPFQGDMLHLSYGKCALFKVLKEDIGDGLYQGGVVQFPLGFESGISRARFNATDGQLYVAGLKGWQTTAAKDACFQRVRYTGKPVTMPTAMHVAADGISITFTNPLDKKAATNLDNYAVDQWNYLWTSEYGSPEVSVEDPSVKERDMVDVDEATLSDDGKTVFLKIADLKPVMQQKIEFRLKTADGKDLNHSIYHTINKVGGPSDKAPAAASAAGK